MRQAIRGAGQRALRGDVPLTAVPLLVGGTATVCVVLVSSARSRSSRARDVTEEIKLPADMSFGERLLTRLRGRGQGNTAREGPTPQVAAATAARLARQKSSSLSSDRPVGQSYFGRDMGSSGLVFSGGGADAEDEDADGAAAEAALEAALAAAEAAEEGEEGMAAANAAQQRRMLLYPLMLFMMMPLWPWAYAFGRKPLVSAERAASWGDKAQQYGSGAANRWAKGRVSSHFEEYGKERAKNAAEARKLRREHYEKGYRSGYTHYHGRAADAYEEQKRGQTAGAASGSGRQGGSGGAGGAGGGGASKTQANAEWERTRRRMQEQARQRAQQQYRAQKRQREQERRDATGAGLLGVRDVSAVDEAELRAAWRATATRLHPDMNPPEEAARCAEKFARAREAYEEACRRRGLTP
jgi:hypothetical protein